MTSRLNQATSHFLFTYALMAALCTMVFRLNQPLPSHTCIDGNTVNDGGLPLSNAGWLLQQWELVEACHSPRLPLSPLRCGNITTSLSGRVSRTALATLATLATFVGGTSSRAKPFDLHRLGTGRSRRRGARKDWAGKTIKFQTLQVKCQAAPRPQPKSAAT